MRVTSVSSRATQAATDLGRPSLTPELLAATGARYSRNNEGLDSILARINPNNPDSSVDSIFRMIDYGHQSIADMAVVSMFIDGVSIWLAYYVWSLCPTAGGQESSTRYIKLAREGLSDPEEIGIQKEDQARWFDHMSASFEAYQHALSIWENHSRENLTSVRLPASLLDDPSEDAKRKVARLRRNYAFDRARYFLPVAARTNLMLVMSSRGWVQLCQHLLSHPAKEANNLGAKIRAELELTTPRLIRHAVADETYRAGIESELRSLAKIGHFDKSSNNSERILLAREPVPSIDLQLPPAVLESDLAESFRLHQTRYSYIGEAAQRTIVRFGWEAVAFAEIRDLNRHRTGTKYCPFRPVGFYSAMEQTSTPAETEELMVKSNVGVKGITEARRFLSEGNSTFVYWTHLGTQYQFEHATTFDKFVYEAELRTGLGAHFRYAKHLSDVLELLYTKFPTLRDLILEGTAEPEV